MLISGGASVMVSSSSLSNRVSISSLFDVIVVVAVAVVVVLCCVPFGGKTERNMFGFGGPDVDESPPRICVYSIQRIRQKAVLCEGVVRRISHFGLAMRDDRRLLDASHCMNSMAL